MIIKAERNITIKNFPTSFITKMCFDSDNANVCSHGKLTVNLHWWSLLFLFFQLLPHCVVKDVWTGGRFRFWLLSRYVVQKAWITQMCFKFVNVSYKEHKKHSATDAYKSPVSCLIIDNQKINKGWFYSLFVFPIAWYQAGVLVTLSLFSIIE